MALSGAPDACPGCGFESPSAIARFCERCGQPLAPRPTSSASEPPGSTPATADLPARFRALSSHPELAALLATPPEIPELAGRTLPSLLLLFGLTVAGALVALVSFQVCPPLGFVPLVLVLVTAGAVVRQMLANSRAPLVARSALVVELRAKLQAGAEHSPDSTRHFATLQSEDGARSEHECYASSLPALAAGALGVAYLKGERLAAFVRFPV